jgi:hypothetical protein
MNKKMVIIGAVLMVALIAAAAFYYVTVIGPRTATLAHVDDLHMQMSASSLGELEAIIRNNADPYTRERAINVYTDIALRSQNPKRALAFLKELAPDEKDDDVRTSAYTNYYFIKKEAGIPPDTLVDIRVTGDIKSGNTITVVLSVTSLRGSNRATVGMEARLLQEVPMISDYNTTEIDANTGKGALTNVVLTPSIPIQRPLPANVTVEFPYTVTINTPGKVVLETSVKVPYNNRLDYDMIIKKIFLDAGSNSGTYAISG